MDKFLYNNTPQAGLAIWGFLYWVFLYMCDSQYLLRIL